MCLLYLNMQYFVKTIVLCSVLTFSGCQLVRDSNGFYTIESRNKDVSKRQQTQEKKKITALDTDTISIKDTKRQEIDTKNIDTSKYIDEPANGGMENKQIVVEKMEQVVREAKDDAKHPNRFVVETSANNEEKKQECNCRCEDNNKPANKQENILKTPTNGQNDKTLYIQVGVFSSFDSANTLAEKLKANGINNVRLIYEDDTTKVVIGGFASKNKGQKTISKLYDIGLEDHFWREIR